MEPILVLKAIVSRLIFIAHGVFCIYRYQYDVAERTKPGETADVWKYWALLTPLIFILVESGVTLVYRKGVEIKYIWVSGFLYITSIIPVIWLVEMDLLEQRIDPSVKNFDVEKCVICKISRLGLIIGLIIGRWLIPRGTLTREQLSTLLLGFVGNSADILELFDTYDDEDIAQRHQQPVTIATLVVFTIAVYQFALVTTATMESPDELNKDTPAKEPRGRLGKNRVAPGKKYTGKRLPLIEEKSEKKDYINDVRTKRKSIAQPFDKDKRGRGKTSTVIAFKRTNTAARTPVPVNEGATEQKENVVKRRKMHGELFQILVTLLMQDGPFLILRAYVMIQFSVSHEMIIFFTCKNAIVSVLLVYRLLILSCSGKDEEDVWHREESEWKLHNIQMAIQNITADKVAVANIYVA